MKRNFILFAFFGILLLSSTNLMAQFELSAEIRPRFEINNGFGGVPTIFTEPTYFVSQRSRLNAALSKEKYKVYFSLQDVRVWGSGDVASGTGEFMSTGGLGIHEIWAEFKVFSNSRIKVGRQVLKYDDQRLLATRNWNQYAITYDALLYSYQRDGWQFDAALSYNNDPSKLGSGGFGKNDFDVNPIAKRLRTVNFIYLKKQITDAFSLSYMSLVTGYQKDQVSSTTYLMGTHGFYGNYQKNALNAKFNAYYQMGKSQTGQDVSAYMLTLEANYQARKLGFGLGMDVLSGQDARNNDADYQKKDHAFDMFYGVRYARYGWMNQYVVQASTRNAGLVDIYPQLTYNLSEKGSVKAMFHFFSLATNASDPFNNGEYLSGSIGQELDIAYNHKFSKEIALNVGFGYYFTNDTFAAVKNVKPDEIETPYFGWVMLTFKPSLFLSEK